MYAYKIGGRQILNIVSAYNLCMLYFSIAGIEPAAFSQMKMSDHLTNSMYACKVRVRTILIKKLGLIATQR